MTLPMNPMEGQLIQMPNGQLSSNSYPLAQSVTLQAVQPMKLFEINSNSDRYFRTTLYKRQMVRQLIPAIN